ncbi:hypothetical protein SDJN03_13088, partial [Cucurbita argyrosperma subsp. sororia]
MELDHGTSRSSAFNPLDLRTEGTPKFTSKLFFLLHTKQEQQEQEQDQPSRNHNLKILQSHALFDWVWFV